MVLNLKTRDGCFVLKDREVLHFLFFLFFSYNIALKSLGFVPLQQSAGLQTTKKLCWAGFKNISTLTSPSPVFHVTWVTVPPTVHLAWRSSFCIDNSTAEALLYTEQELWPSLSPWTYIADICCCELFIFQLPKWRRQRGLSLRKNTLFIDFF